MLNFGELLRARSAASPRQRDTSFEDKLSVRATNPDNMIEAQKLVELFSNAYGQNYFVKQVYDEGFWYGQEADDDRSFREELISIIGEDRGRFVGHLALHHRAHSGVVQLMLPAVHPAYRKFVFHLSRIFWRYVERLATRQNWQLLYHHTLVSHPVSQLVAAKCFRSIEVALLPNHSITPGESCSVTRRHLPKSSLLLSMNPLNTETLPAVTIYAPDRHLAAIKELYHPLRLDRVFAPGTSIAPIGSSILPVRQPEISQCSVTGLCRIFIFPSEVSDINDVVRRENARVAASGKRLFVFLALDDPHCPFACQALERDGYRFCGILPVITGRDVVILSQFENFELDSTTLYSPRAKGIRGYILESSQLDPHRLH